MAGEPTNVTQCPFCKEDILAEAIVCKHCGSRLKSQGLDHGGVCPYCKEEIHPDATRCRHCRSDLARGGGSAKQGCGCGGGCAGCGGAAGQMLPGAMIGGTAFQPAMRSQQYGVGGECYNRCMLYCGGPACEFICAFICEHAPVTRPPNEFLTR